MLFSTNASPPRLHKHNTTIIIFKLDVDPRRDDDASPMSSYRCKLRPTWMLISALWHKSKFNFELCWKKKNLKFWGFHAVVLVKTFPLMYQLLMYDWYWRSKGDFSTSAQVKFNFELYWKIIQIFGFSCCSTRKDLSIDESKYQYINY